jgi:hypothetical protein
MDYLGVRASDALAYLRVGVQAAVRLRRAAEMAIGAGARIDRPGTGHADRHA